MSDNPVTYKLSESVALLTINRPERRNAIDGPTAAALHGAFQKFVADDSARVLVVTGAGGQAFCAGADLKSIETIEKRESGWLGFTHITSPKPTIAAIEGWCVAGGLELALWCDIRVASESSKFGCLERRWGVPLVDGGTQRLPRVVGLGRALDLILTGKTIDAAEAEHIGLLNYVVESGSAVDSAVALAEELANFPWETVISDRDAIYRGIGMPLDEGFKMETELGEKVVKVGVQGAQIFAGGAGRSGQPF